MHILGRVALPAARDQVIVKVIVAEALVARWLHVSGQQSLGIMVWGIVKGMDRAARLDPAI